MAKGPNTEREKFIQAGLELLEEMGLEGLSSRRVAKRANSSTMPLYSEFGSMDVLREEIYRKVGEVFIDYSNKEYTDDKALNIGLGTVLFASDHPNTFKALFMESSKFKDTIPGQFHIFIDRISVMDGYRDLPRDDMEILLRRLWVLTYSLATMECLGISEFANRDEVVFELSYLGGLLIRDTFSKAGIPY